MSDDRLRALARETAFNRHANYCLDPKSDRDHVQGMNDTEWGFSTCPHPDCVLVQAPAAEPPKDAQQFSERPMFTPRQLDEQTKPLHVEIERLKKELAVTDEILATRERLLALFDCPVHGAGCVPHAIEEVERLRAAASPALAAQTQEICICAAIQFSDGRIVRGHRHDACFRTAEGWTPTPPREGHIQGFITSQNRFVGREEGANIQNAAGLKSAHHGGVINGELFSEDLYFDTHDHVAWNTPYTEPSAAPAEAGNPPQEGEESEPNQDYQCGQPFGGTERWAYECTRRRGHAGDHVAHGHSGNELHRWPVAPPGAPVQPKEPTE